MLKIKLKGTIKLQKLLTSLVNSEPKVQLFVGILVFLGVFASGYFIIRASERPIELAIQATVTAEARQTQSSITPTSPPQLVYSLQNDEIPITSNQERFHSGKIMENFMAKVTFHTPYSADVSTWSAGIIFGDNNKIILHSFDSGQWAFQTAIRPNSNKLNLPTSLLLQEGEQNTLTLLVFEDKGCFFVNDQFVADLDLENLNTSGQISLVTHYYAGDSLPNEEVPLEFSDFEIYAIDSLECN